jgi:flagellar motor switch protein FliN/FliY
MSQGIDGMTDPSQPISRQMASPSPVRSGRSGKTVDHSAPERKAGGEIELLLSEAEQALDAVSRQDAGPPVKPFYWRDLNDHSGQRPHDELELVGSVELDLSIEMGRARLTWKEVNSLVGGSVLALDKKAGDPVDILAGDRLIARGEVLVLADKYCVRVTELTGSE